MRWLREALDVSALTVSVCCVVGALTDDAPPTFRAISVIAASLCVALVFAVVIVEVRRHDR